MQLPTWLFHVIKSGEISVFTGEEKALQVKAKNNKIELSIDNRDFFKDLIESAGVNALTLDKLGQLKEIAEELREKELTINLSYRKEVLVIMGLEAKPKFLRLITRTNAIEVKNLRTLLELSI